MYSNNTNLEKIETPLGTLEIAVPNLESIKEISPIEQYRIDLYRYIVSRKSVDPDCEIPITDVLTVPVIMTQDGKSFLPANQADFPIVAMEFNAFMDVTDNLKDNIDEESLMREDSPRSHGLLAKINLAKSNYSDALRHAYIGAKNGDINSLVILGVMYAEGLGVERDNGKAKIFYLSGVMHGNHHALCNLGLMLIHSHDSDIELIRKLFERSALQGNVFGAHNLGTSLLESGVPDCVEKGLAWLRSSAEAGYELSVIVLIKYYKFIHDYESYSGILNAGISQGFTSCRIEQMYYNNKKQDESPFQWTNSK